MSPSERIAVFAYGSLVSRASAESTLGREIPRIWPAELEGWRRGFIQARRNRECEKTFARVEAGEVPDDPDVPVSVLGLGVAPEPGAWCNGGLIEIDEPEAARLDRRELRYVRCDVTEAVRGTDPSAPAFDRVITYVARSENQAPEPPEPLSETVILRSYLEATEAAFAELGAGELDRFRRSTTLPEGVEVIEGRLIRDEIPLGNPRSW